MGDPVGGIDVQTGTSWNVGVRVTVRFKLLKLYFCLFSLFFRTWACIIDYLDQT